MLNRRARAIPAVVMLTALISTAGGAALANGGSPGELLKYLNPVQKKGYLNQSQDRLIKKKKFKASQMPKAVATTNKEIGFFAIVPATKLTDSQFIEQLVTNQRINGLSVLVPWSMLEPTEGEYNWTVLDNILDQAGKQSKSVIVRISSAGVDLPSSEEISSDTPKWVFDGEVKSVTYIGLDGKQHKMPVFWDTSYLAKWSQFVKAFGKKYDNNPNIHSVGITGGGFGGSTSVVPDVPFNESDAAQKAQKENNDKLVDVLKKEHGMTPRQIVEHWKYAADIFPKRFTNARLNFNINPPTKNRAGEDMLDEISDYLVYRYGNRVYLTRRGAKGKHGFDDYRVLLKFRNDTVSGLQAVDGLKGPDVQNLAKFALDDGISYVEIPAELATTTDETVKAALDNFASHIGYQIVSQKSTLPTQVAQGEPLKANFSFINLGAATLMRSERQFDKDLPVSYKIQIELRDSTGKPVVQNHHTPGTPTNQWTPGQVVTWEEELRLPSLNPGEYTAFMSIVDPATKRKIQFLDAITSSDNPVPTTAAEIGKIKVVAGPPADKKVVGSGETKIAPDQTAR